VFIIVGSILVATNLVFVIFGSSKVQPWNEPRLMNKGIEENGTEDITTKATNDNVQ